MRVYIMMVSHHKEPYEVCGVYLDDEFAYEALEKREKISNDSKYYIHEENVTLRES